jgi:hypothetical protein
MTEELFHEYLTNVLLLHIQQLSEDPGLAEELGVLLVDSVGAHVSQRNSRLLGENRIIASVFPAHTIDLFQALDRVSLSAMKKNKDSHANEPAVALVHGQVWKIGRAYEQTATSFTIRLCCRKAGLSPDTQARPFKLELIEEALRRNDGFTKVWDRNISGAELSRRRRGQRSGIPNTEFFDACGSKPKHPNPLE